MTIERFESVAAMAEAAAQAVAAGLRRALEVKGRALFIATGGRTSGAIYDCLASSPLDWAAITVLLTDERWVDQDDPDSNARLVRERLLRGPAAAARFIPLRGGQATPETAAMAANRRLADLPAADVALIGMGEDGHIASLFPGSPALALGLDPAAPACIPVPRAQDRLPPQARLSLTAPVLAAAREVVLPIIGQAKLDVVSKAQAGSDALELPVRAILRGGADVRIVWSA